MVELCEEWQDAEATAVAVLYIPGNREAVPIGDIIMPMRCRDAACAINDEADPEFLRAIEIIGG